MTKKWDIAYFSSVIRSAFRNDLTNQTNTLELTGPRRATSGSNES